MEICTRENISFEKTTRRQKLDFIAESVSDAVYVHSSFLPTLHHPSLLCLLLSIIFVFFSFVFFIPPIYAFAAEKKSTTDIFIESRYFDPPRPDSYYGKFTGSRIFQETLPNGLRVIVHERPGTGIVSAELIIKVGVMQEMENCAGITTLIQNLVLRGEIPNSTLPLQESVEEDGCIINSSANPDYAAINLISTKDVFKRNLGRLIHVIRNPNFSEKNLEEQKQKLSYKIENNRSAYQTINEIFLKQFYRYHPYRQPIYGFKNTVNRLKLYEIKSYFEKFYTANRMTLAISGDVNGPEMLDFCRKIMSDIPHCNIDVVDIPWEPMGQEKKLYLETSSELAWIFIGFPAPDIKSPDYPKMKILQTLLGDGLSSRLFIELREKEGLAYELDANYPELEGPSHIIIYVVTNGANLNKARRKIFEEINNLKKKKVSEEELEATKRKLRGKYLSSSETSAGKAHSLAFYTALGLGSSFEEVLLERMQAVTADDIQNVARKYLENYTVLEIQPSQGEVVY